MIVLKASPPLFIAVQRMTTVTVNSQNDFTANVPVQLQLNEKDRLQSSLLYQTHNSPSSAATA